MREPLDQIERTNDPYAISTIGKLRALLRENGDTLAEQDQATEELLRGLPDDLELRQRVCVFLRAHAGTGEPVYELAGVLGEGASRRAIRLYALTLSSGTTAHATAQAAIDYLGSPESVRPWLGTPTPGLLLGDAVEVLQVATAAARHGFAPWQRDVYAATVRSVAQLVIATSPEGSTSWLYATDVIARE